MPTAVYPIRFIFYFTFSYYYIKQKLKRKSKIFFSIVLPLRIRVDNATDAAP